MSDAAPSDKALVRYETPDCEEIRNLIREDPKGRSADKLMKDAGLESGSRLLRLWEKGKPALRSTLTRLAKELSGCQNIDQIIVNAIPTPNITDFACPLMHYGSLVFDAIFSQSYFHAGNLEGSFNNVEIGDFIQHHYRRRISELHITLPQIVAKLREFCRTGWLREADTPNGPQFYLRIWLPRQCNAHYRNRNMVERNAILYAFYLSQNPEDEGAIREHKDIIRHQQKTLDQLQVATAKLLREPAIENAIEVIRLDCQFHQGWGGYDASTISLLTIGIGGHLQLFCRLFTLQSHLERKGWPLPDDFKRLPELVMGFYEELTAIFQKFLVAASAGNNFAIRGVLRAARNHSKSGYKYSLEVERLLSHYRSQED